MFLFSGADKPRIGEPVFVFAGIPPGETRRAPFPRRDGSKVHILLVQDSLGTRYTLAHADNTYIAHRSGRRGARSVDIAVEHGHMDLSEWGRANGIIFYHYAVSGLRLVSPGSGTALELIEDIRFVGLFEFGGFFFELSLLFCLVWWCLEE